MGGGWTSTGTEICTLIAEPAVTVPVIVPPGLSGAAVIRNSSVTDSLGCSPRSFVQVTVPVPPGHDTTLCCRAAFNTNTPGPASRDAPTALTPGGKLSAAVTGSDTLPPVFVTVIGKSLGPLPGASVIGVGDGADNRGGLGGGGTG